MTVAELISVLETFPPEMKVFTTNECADEGTSHSDPNPELGIYYLDRYNDMSRFCAFIDKDKLLEAVFL